MHDFQLPYARPAAEVADWNTARPGRPGLAETVAAVHPTMLIGTSTQTGAFTEDIVRDMAAHTDRPIIMPLSNPTSRCEAQPEDLIRWTDGRALIATGSPFPPVPHNGPHLPIAQANNALVFPGLGLGVTVARASRITDRMSPPPPTPSPDSPTPPHPGHRCYHRWTTSGPSPPPLPSPSPSQPSRKDSHRYPSTTRSNRSTKRCGGPTTHECISDASAPGAPLLPPMTDLRAVSAAVAIAVAAAAAKEGLAQAELYDPIQQVHDAMWRPVYPRIEIRE